MATTRAPRSPATSRGVLLDLVRARGPISRVELAQVTGLTQATVSILVRQLLADGLVADAGRSESTGGKPRELLALVPSARVALGLQLEADSTTAIVADLAGSVVGRLRTRGVLDEGPESFVRGLVDRGEASWADQEGKLPSGVTHEIVGQGPSGLPIVIERRKKLF